MKFKALIFAAVMSVASTMSASAVTYNLGDVTNGTTVTNTLSVRTVDFLNFVLDALPGFEISALSISLTSTVGSNFGEVLALYSSDGTLISSVTAAQRGGGNGVTLSFLGAPALANGSYTLGVAGRNAFFPNDIADARSTASFRNGVYTVQIDPTLSAVPLPAGVLLLISGLGACALTRRRSRAA